MIRRLLALMFLVLIPLQAGAQIIAPGTKVPVEVEVAPDGKTLLWGLLQPTPPPVVQFALTLPVTGSGSTVGQGPHPAGALVTIAGTPAAGQTFKGWTGPAPCPQDATSPSTFAMPAAALECTATFTLIPPPPFTLTIALTGLGTATTAVQPPGPQIAETPRALTVTPAGGSVLGAWSPGCADTMPQPAADTVCTRPVDPPPTPPAGTGTAFEFNEGTGMTTTSTSGAMGTLVGPPTWVTGAEGTALKYGGNKITQIAPHPSINDLFKAPGGTVGLCINAPDNGAGDIGIILNRASAPITIYDGWGLTHRPSGGLQFIVGQGPGRWDTVAALPKNQMVKVVIVWADGTTPLLEFNDVVMPVTRTQAPGGPLGHGNTFPLNIGNYSGRDLGSNATVDRLHLAPGQVLNAAERMAWFRCGEGTPPPPTYSLSVTVSGPGSVTGTGSYIAGANVTLSANAQAGSTFQWSGRAVCPQSTNNPVTLVMPASALACAVTITPPVGPPPSASVEWTFLSNGNPAESVPNWYNIAVDVQGRMYTDNWRGELWRFDPATLEHIFVAQMHPAGNNQHNCTFTGDLTLHRIWYTGQCGNTFPGTSPVYFDIVAGTVGTHTSGPPGGSNSAGVYDPDAKRLLTFGGWLTSPDLYANLSALSLAPLGAWQRLGPLTPHPEPTGECDRLAHTRAGWDSKRHRAWNIMADGDLWVLSNGAWIKLTTTGAKPEACTVYAYYAGIDRIVGWTGENQAAGGGGGQLIGKTRLLDIDALQWSVAPTTVTPPVVAQVTNAMAYDAVRDQVIGRFAGKWYALRATGTPSPPTYPVTVSAAGPGTGAVTGNGSYLAGATVTLGATPASGSLFAGWSPAPCAPNFVMPSSALACIATFTVQSGGGGGGGGGGEPALPLRTFVARPVPRDPTSELNTMWLSPWATGSKDVSFTQARDLVTGRSYIITGTGDYAQPPQSSGHNTLYRVDIEQTRNKWTMIALPCYGPGEVSLTRPSDRGLLAFDPRGGPRGVVWQLTFGRGFASPGDVCIEQAHPGDPTGSIDANGLMRLDLSTGKWTKVADMGVSGTNEGVVIPDEDLLLFLDTDAGSNCSLGGIRIVALNLTTLVKTQMATSCYVPSPTYVEGGGTGWLGAVNAHLGRFAWDAKRKRAFVCGIYQHYTAGAQDGQQMYACHKYDHATRTITPVAPMPQPPAINGPLYVAPTYDSRNDVVIWPASKLQQCAVIVAVLVYTPASDTWESFAPVSNTLAATDMRGSIAAFDHDSNAVFVADSGSCSSPYEGFTPPMLWRYR